MTVTALHADGRDAPPQDVLAERSVLGACLLAPTAVDDITDTGLRGPDFYQPAHETIWSAVQGLRRRGTPVDAVTLAAALSASGDLARIGGPAYLHTLLSTTPTAANVGYYAGIVREKATLRRLVAAGTRIAQLGYATDGGDVDELVNAAQAEVAAVADARLTFHGETLDEVADKAMELLEGGVPAVPSPWGTLNHLIDGLRPAHFYVTGARPASGKTLLALQWAISYARQQRDQDGPQAVYLTWEASSARLYQRALASASGVSQNAMRKQRLTDDDWRAIVRADEYLRGLPIVLEGASGKSVPQARARVKQLHRKRPVGHLVVDHIGLTRPERSKDNRQAELSEATDLLLALAHELDAAVHVLTQLNRGPTQRADQRPVPSDIRDTDRLEQNADVLLLLHRDKDKDPKHLDVSVAKHRDGEEGAVRLQFDGDRARLGDVPNGGRA